MELVSLVSFKVLVEVGIRVWSKVLLGESHSKLT